MRLDGFKSDDLKELSEKMVEMHSSVYNWNAKDTIDPVIDDIVDIQEKTAQLTGGNVTPRNFVKKFVSVLDTVQQNQVELNNKNNILKLFEKEEEIDIDDF